MHFSADPKNLQFTGPPATYIFFQLITRVTHNKINNYAKVDIFT